MRGSGWAAMSMVMVLVGACSVQAPAASSQVAETDDPARVLNGRGVEALGAGGTVDVVARINAEGFRLSDDERLYEIYGDRVLSFRVDPAGESTALILRDLEGTLIREIVAPFELLRAAMVRGEDVYFAGMDQDEDTQALTDRGAWVAHGDASPAPILAPAEGHTVYFTIKLSADGRTVGITVCHDETCRTALLGRDGATREVAPGLIELTNDVVLVTNSFSEVMAIGVADGTERWRASTPGFYEEHYTTTDGTRFVIASNEDSGDGDENIRDQLRIQVLNAQSGAVEATVVLPNEDSTLATAPSLSSDRYVAVLDNWRPDVDEGPHPIKIVDLVTRQLLDVELAFGPVP